VTVSVVQTAAAAATSGTTWSGSFSSNVTPGNTVILAVDGYLGATFNGVSSNPKFNGAAVAGASQVFPDTGNSTCGGTVWMLPNVSGGAVGFSIDVTAGYGGANTLTGVMALEVAGLGPSPALDRLVSSISAQTVTTPAISSASEFVLALLVQDNTYTSGPGAGWTAGPLIGPNHNSATWYQIATSAGGTYSAVYSLSANFVIAVVTIAATATAGPAAVQPQPGGKTWRRRYRRHQVVQQALAVPAPATATGTLSIAGTATAAAPATASGALAVAGTSTGQAPVAATGSFAVAGTATEQAPVAATGSLALTGTGTEQAPVAATGSLALTGTGTAGGNGAVTASGALAVTGTATGQVTAQAAGSVAVAGTATAAGAAAAIGSIVVAGTGTASVTASGAVTLAGTATARSPATATGTVALAGTATSRAAGGATGVVTFTGSATAAGPGGFVSFGSALPTSVLSAYTGPGYQGGPSGAGSVPPSALGNGWEIEVRSAADYATLLAVIPGSMLLSWQFARMLNDIGSGTVVLNQDDSWWEEVTLPGGLPAETLLDDECLWQVWKDGVCRFDFFGETVTEQLVDSSEQRQATVTGPGTLTSLKWAMVAPQGFPDIVLKLDGLLDAFDEVDNNGNPVLDTNIWTTASPSSDVYITPIAVIYNYPTGAGYALSTLYPSGSLTLSASPGTTFLGASPYDATDTLISAQITPVGVSSSSTDTSTPATYGTGLDGSELTQFYIQSNYSSQNYAMIGLSATAFYAQMGSGGHVQTQILPAYDSSNHAYWMITEQAGSGGGSGTFYFWTSPDGQAWTQQWTVVHSWDATNVTFYVTAAYSTSGSQTVQLTNLNSNVTTPSYQGQIYLGVPMMGVWLDQFSQAQARGTIPFVTSTVTAGADSFGRAWTDTENVQATNGTDLYSFLQGATSVVDADYVMNPGFQLVVGVPAAGQVAVGVDRSGYIIFREGHDIQAKQRTRARDQIATLIGGENSDGHEISADSPTFIAEWGQREAWFQTSAQVDPVSMAYATASSLAENETEVVSWTFQLLPNVPGKTIFDNFDVGDWVGLERPDFSAVDTVRVVGIAVQVDSSGAETHELTFLSYIQWLAEQLTYLANKLGGSFVNTLGTSPVAPSKYGTGQVPTYFTPAATLSGLADVTSTAGSAQGTAPLVYNPATGTYQHAGSTDPVTGQPVPVTISTPGGSVTVGDTTVVVNTGNGSTTTGLQGDGTVTTVDSGGSAPAAPDTPAVAGIVQGLVVGWDGLLASAHPLSNFQAVQVHVSTSTGFTPSSATLKGTLTVGGVLTVSGLTAGTTYFAKLVAVTTAGMTSAPSAQASAVAASVPTSLLTGQLPASLIGNSAGNALNPNPFFNGGDLTGWFVTNGTVSSSAPPAGAPGAAQFAAKVISTSANCLLTGSTAPFPVTPGQPYVMTSWVYNPGGSAVNVAIGFNWTSGTTTVSVPPSTWVPLTTVQTCPGGVTSAYQVIGPTASGVTVWVLGAVAAGQVPGQLIAANSIAAQQIAAGTITATQIAASTITASQIAASTITAGQIAASTITAAQIAASTITATQIAAGTITASKLVSGIVVAGIIDGTTITGAQFVAYGTTGEILVYSSTPTTGNLVLSVSATASTDGHSNPYPAGLGLFNSSSKYTTLAASSAGNLTLGTGAGGGGGLEMVTQATTPNSDNSIFYADGNSSAAYRKGSGGLNGQLVVAQTDDSSITNTTASYIPITAQWLIPAGDAVNTTTYRLTCWGIATYTGAVQNVGFRGYINGTNEGAWTFPSSFVTTSTCWRVEYIINVLSAGSSGSAQYTLTAWLNNSSGVGASSSPQAFDTTVNNTMYVEGTFATGATTVTLTCYGSIFERLGA
jgi:hypothetical protein